MLIVCMFSSFPYLYYMHTSFILYGTSLNCRGGWAGRSFIRPRRLTRPQAPGLWTRRPPQCGALDERAQRNNTDQPKTGRARAARHHAAWGTGSQVAGVLVTACTPWARETGRQRRYSAPGPAPRGRPADGLIRGPATARARGRQNRYATRRRRGPGVPTAALRRNREGRQVTAAGNDRRRRIAKTDRADQAASRSARDPARGR